MIKQVKQKTNETVVRADELAEKILETIQAGSSSIQPMVVTIYAIVPSRFELYPPNDWRQGSQNYDTGVITEYKILWTSEPYGAR